MLSGAIRIEWPASSPVALFENNIAMALFNAGYASDLTDEQLEEYNSLVDKAPAQEPVQEPATGNGSAPNEFPADWLPHPTSPGYYYKGNEVLTEADLRARLAQ